MARTENSKKREKFREKEFCDPRTGNVFTSLIPANGLSFQMVVCPRRKQRHPIAISDDGTITCPKSIQFQDQDPDFCLRHQQEILDQTKNI